MADHVSSDVEGFDTACQMDVTSRVCTLTEKQLQRKLLHQACNSCHHVHEVIIGDVFFQCFDHQVGLIMCRSRDLNSSGQELIRPHSKYVTTFSKSL